MVNAKAKARYGIYSVEEEYDEKGLWIGYRCGVVGSEGKKEGKLYIKSDGREHYRDQNEKPNKGTSEDLEI